METWKKESELLQSNEWLSFQESFGRKTHQIENESFSAGLIEHALPVVGRYLYCPRGPLFFCHSERDEVESKNLNPRSLGKLGMTALIELAKENGAGWIRIDPKNNEELDFVRKNISQKIEKAPHDMQPKENFVLDISKSEEQLLAEMKPKTRYNIRLAQKHKVIVQAISKSQFPMSKQYEDTFLKLTKQMAERQGIATHPESYYRKMIESIPSEMLQIYSAEYEGKIIATNLVVFFGNTATYLHGASGDEHRNVMAPYLLQWQAILDAKEKGCTKYDFGGIKLTEQSDLTPTLSFLRRGSKGEVASWAGITQFKTGFSPGTKPVVFPGSYDIIINSRKYRLYKGLQKAKALLRNIRK